MPQCQALKLEQTCILCLHHHDARKRRELLKRLGLIPGKVCVFEHPLFIFAALVCKMPEKANSDFREEEDPVPVNKAKFPEDFGSLLRLRLETYGR